MRLLSVLSGILLSASGAFCFAFYTNAFQDVAFVVSLAMIVSGITGLAAYIIAARKNDRLPDSMMVEGIVNILYGISVLNNQVSDVMLTMFFGSWMALAGATRLSQALYVRRHNRRDWFSIMPLVAFDLLLGLVLLMPNFVKAAMPMTLIGAAQIINGFSMLLYLMYMKPHTPSKRELEAQKKAEARHAGKLEKKQKKKEFKQLSREKQKAAQEKFNEEKEAQRIARLREKEEKHAAKMERMHNTIGLSPDDVGAIAAADSSNVQSVVNDINKSAMNERKQLVSESGQEMHGIKAAPLHEYSGVSYRHLSGDSPRDKFASAVKLSGEKDEVFDYNIHKRPTEKEGEFLWGENKPQKTPKNEKSFAASINAGASFSEKKTSDATQTFVASDYFDIQKDPANSLWNKPKDIPSLLDNFGDLSNNNVQQQGRQQKEKPLLGPKHSAVNLESIEAAEPSKIEFDSVKLPEVKVLSESHAPVERDKVLDSLNREISTPVLGRNSYTPIELQDLIDEPLAKGRQRNVEQDRKRFTQTLIFNWYAEENN